MNNINKTLKEPSFRVLIVLTGIWLFFAFGGFMLWIVEILNWDKWRYKEIREIKYKCGCHLKEKGIKICTLHLVMFEDLLKKVDFNRFGWDVNQDTYNKIVHCLNTEEQEGACAWTWYTMKKTKEIEKRIEELKEERDARYFTQSTRSKYNRMIGELEWVLDN